jgi:hypothetical protein
LPGVRNSSTPGRQEKGVFEMTGTKRTAGERRVVLIILVGFLCMGLIVVTTIFAQAPKPKSSGPCAADIAKLCKDVDPRKGGIARCLKQHEKDLSPECRASTAEARQQTRGLASACRGDAEKFCKNVQPGGGRIEKCLRSHKEELSPDCRTQLLAPKRVQ